MLVREVLDDLIAEQAALDEVMTSLDDAAWGRPTPSPGWTVTDQVGHLTYFDATAALAIADPEGFRTHRSELVVAMADPAAVEIETLGRYRAMAPTDLLAAWRDNRRALADAAADLAEDARVEWYGPSMGAKSFLTARLMEVWAHGQDIVDTVGAARAASDRIRHIVQLGVITRGWSYRNRGLEPPAGEVSVTLTAPSGATWTWEHEGAVGSVTGSAEDFCLVVTQRRHVDDTGLAVEGAAARDWMIRAQAFAGGATDGPSAGTWA